MRFHFLQLKGTRPGASRRGKRNRLRSRRERHDVLRQRGSARRS